jgi:transcriptional regulator with XRE-family HTH domain
MDEQHLTIAETARRMREHLPEGESVSISSISQYRTGRVMPRPQHLRALSLALAVEEVVLAPQREPSSTRMAPMVRVHASNKNIRRGPVEKSERIEMRDLGDEVHLTINQRVPWAVVIQVLELLKGKME